MYGKQEKVLTEDSKALIKELRLKAAAREQTESNFAPMSSARPVVRSDLVRRWQLAHASFEILKFWFWDDAKLDDAIF